MSIPFMSPWLPRGLSAHDATSDVQDIVTKWSAHWVGAGRIRLSPLPTNCDRVRQKSLRERWMWAGELACLGLSKSAAVGIASHILRKPDSAAAERPSDRLLLEQLGERVLDNLLERLLEAGGVMGSDALRKIAANVPANECEFRWWTLSWVSGGLPILLGVTDALQTRMRRACLTPTKQIELRSVRSALAAQPVEIGSRIGTCALKLSEISSLAVGDVVVLDRAPDDQLDLTVGSTVTDRHCQLEQDDLTTTLVLSSAGREEK